MNKWLVLVIVVLLALLAALQIVHRKQDGYKKQITQKTQAKSSGVSMPADTRISDKMLDAHYANLDRAQLPAIKNIAGACKKGSLKDIMDSYGKLWGDEFQGDNEHAKLFFTKKKSDIYKLAVHYFACQAAANREPLFCEPKTQLDIPGIYAPAGTMTPEESREDVNLSFNGICRDSANRVMFAGYMSGLHKNEITCRAFIQGNFMDMENLSMPSGDFCAVASKGMENICRSISKHLPSDSLCLGTFPRNKQDCKTSKICLDNLKIYTAIKNSKPQNCPSGYKEICRAFINRDSQACKPIAKRLSSSYCETFKKYQKKLSEEKQKVTNQEQKEALVKKKEKKAMAKEMDKMNKRIRELLGKD